MAFGFIKKVFSFGRKEVAAEPSEEARPLPAPQTGADIAAEASAPTPQPVPEEPAPAPTPAEPEPAEPVPSEPEVPATPEVPAEPKEVPAPAPVEVPAPPTPQEVPTQRESAPEAPVVSEAPAPPGTPAVAEPPPAAAPDASGPSDRLLLKEEEAVAVPPPSPLKEGQGGEADRGEAVRPPEAAETPLAAVTPAPSPKAASGKVTVAKKVEQKAAPQEAPAPAAPRRSWFQRMREGLARSSKELSGNIAGVFTRRKLDDDTLQDLEDVLIRADLGVETALRVTDALASSRYGKDVSDAEVREVMAAEVEKVLKPVALPLELDLSHKPHVILVVGVNGTGKTTTIGKLAAKLTAGGLSVMLAAGDTFRAAAIEQLKIWGERTGSPVVATKLGADAAGLAYDAFEKARAAGSDVLIIDTAGRLQNKAELMAELEKIVRVLGKLDPEAPHTVLQTVDATTGQNALNQVEIFRNVAGVNGLVMTKLDGTARGGILVAIAARHKLPVYFIGVGEQVDDLEPFSAGDFAKAIAGVG